MSVAQFISNEHDVNNSWSLKLTPVSNQLKSVTSGLHSSSWLLCAMNERCALYTIIPSLRSLTPPLKSQVISYTSYIIQGRRCAQLNLVEAL